VVKYKTENGYIGKVEMPNRMYSLDSIKRAIKQDIQRTLTICGAMSKGKKR